MKHGDMAELKLFCTEQGTKTPSNRRAGLIECPDIAAHVAVKAGMQKKVE